ncbi:bifunctional diaminohydroxyphosphoribosylaminopyrimidine deaminase/5-amino-6-(5-phosphoribosylamino)uracil reductase RibD [Cytobacillus sp. IB215665]|uniref:bifunctional diaminohydroxyphosphoribosylaminopyrimidine deaminase/5-amino-6-(5-phosphoribosylamino)uracil reductase RibD n=1 Tax=Cytobacillus sp. IB215665 TaxID=3097357 RepID=UPI002A0B101E|nr:bifunctional diaminohydroxyphosphoribosylaminopyrimidine deaminase/5-amino-6-(5-phosphoribosylamino)uracil reductase RibD [Cytobacillus sp. IB215665]MDX8364777.1 bifunctional diaminohydroxyphosphoribosylaminopyrimidine deaminase/5-amino-6-(5-phosphoribosylamino)uracil reductase RibD [Cytobacillus sp. IB215665]
MNDHDYMRVALEMAKSTIGQTSPNPVVGAVVVNRGQIVGLGTHLKAGEAHAEVHAINMAGNKAKDGTIYVTLEPCSHFGQTPPCVDLLISSGVSRVVIACEDPNPSVAGRGIRKLEEAGLKVDVGVLQDEAKKLNKVFFRYIKNNTPFVTLKTAISMDGKIATQSGESKWITGELARQDVHKYRHRYDAILVGVNTVVADNPSLTARLPYETNNPIRIILDTKLRTPLDSKVITDGLAPTWIVVGEDCSDDEIACYTSQKNVRIIQMREKRINIKDLLRVLGGEGITSLFVEGGGKVNTSFLKADVVQQYITYIAPKLIGGECAPTSFNGEGFDRLYDVPKLQIKSIEQLGEDIKLIAIPKNK